MKLELENKAGKTFTCEMTRNSLREAEKIEGFNLQDTGKVLTNMYGLFYASLVKNHKTMTFDQACELLDELTTADETGETLYSYAELSEAIGEMTRVCYQDISAKGKKQLKKI